MDGCTRYRTSHGYCATHLYRWQRYGDPLRLPSQERAAKSLEERFWELVDRSNPDSCWLWQGWKDHKGYGLIQVNGRQYRAHRVGYELAHGPVPAGLLVCHHCDVPSCVRGDHLFVGTEQDNADDMVAKGRQAVGERHNSVRWPEKMARGERKGNARLVDAQVREMRTLYATGGWSTRALAARFGVGKTVAHLVVSGRIWTHVE